MDVVKFPAFSGGPYSLWSGVVDDDDGSSCSVAMPVVCRLEVPAARQDERDDDVSTLGHVPLFSVSCVNTWLMSG